MVDKKKSLIFYNIYKIENKVKNSSKNPAMTFAEFALLKLRDVCAVKHYESVLNKTTSLISDKNIELFRTSYGVDKNTSQEIQLIFVLSGVYEDGVINFEKSIEMFENHCYTALAWDDVAKEENRYVTAEGYSALTIDAFKRAYGFYELSNGGILVTDF